MKGYHIRTLQRDDASRLEQFEHDNRQWFEQHIESRGEQFYSPQGVRAHIEQFLDAYSRGRLHPCIVLDHRGDLVGRANLKNIDQHAGTSEIGYRIAESQVGKGMATAAVQHLIDVARSRWQLKELYAFVANTNSASVRVLEKSQFQRCGAQQTLLFAGGAWIPGHRFAVDLGKVDR